LLLKRGFEKIESHRVWGVYDMEYATREFILSDRLPILIRKDVVFMRYRLGRIETGGSQEMTDHRDYRSVRR